MGILEEILDRIQQQQKQVNSLISEIAELRQNLPLKDDPWLRFAEIKSELDISDSTFIRSLPKLVRFGAVKDGQWKMRKSALDNYKNSINTPDLCK